MSRRVVLAAASWLALSRGAAVLATDTLQAAKAPPAKGHAPLPAFNEPAEAGPDFPLQGEYSATVEGPEGLVKYGVQISARDRGKFHGVAFRGGLPGAGWDRTEKLEADGQVQNGVVTFDVPAKATASIAAGTLTVRDESGRVLGTFTKVLRQSSTLGAQLPTGAVVLFDGTSTDNWKNGRMTLDHLLMEEAVSNPVRFRNIWVAEKK